MYFIFLGNFPDESALPMALIDHINGLMRMFFFDSEYCAKCDTTLQFVFFCFDICSSGISISSVFFCFFVTSQSARETKAAAHVLQTIWAYKDLRAALNKAGWTKSHFKVPRRCIC